MRPNETKMSDGGRGRASLGVKVWKSSQEWSVRRSAVRSSAWLGRCSTVSLHFIEYHTPLGHFWCGNAKMQAILGDPILGLLGGLIDARLILADRHGKSTDIGANEAIADEPAGRANETLHLGRAHLQASDE